MFAKKENVFIEMDVVFARWEKITTQLLIIFKKHVVKHKK